MAKEDQQRGVGVYLGVERLVSVIVFFLPVADRVSVLEPDRLGLRRELVAR